jgi:hypothetical protein
MNCGICNYNWCWTCGFEVDHFFHKLTNEVFCDFINFFNHDFPISIHWTLQILLFLIIFALWPVYVLIVVPIGLAFQFNYFICRERVYCMRFAGLKIILLIPLFLIQISLVYSLVVIMTSIAIIMFYIPA